MSPLLDYARKHVTPQDIRDFSPNDPGYLNYVEEWERIRETGRLPAGYSFDFFEPINHEAASAATPSRWDPARYRRYRGLLFSAALLNPSMLSSAPAVLAALLDDALSLKDETLLRLLAEAGDSLADDWSDENALGNDPQFLLLWRFLLACVLPDRHGTLTASATKVLRAGCPDSEDLPSDGIPEWTMWPHWIKSRSRRESRVWRQLITECLACAPDTEACRNMRQQLPGETPQQGL